MSDNKHRYFTFLYVPADNSGLKTIRIPKWVILSVLTVGSIVVLSGIVGAVKYSSKLRDTYRLTQLDSENEVLRAELAEFEREVAVLNRQVQQNFDFQKKARILANLDDLSDDVAEVGIGGPSTGYMQSLTILDPDTRESVTGVRQDLGKLVRQARLQSENYNDIIGNLAEQQKRLHSTPSVCPVGRGYVSSRYGHRMDPITGRRSFHHGLDYSARLGTPVLATADGIVTFSGKWGGFGWTVEVSHGYDIVTRYAHCSKLLVKKGQRVRRGDVIARVGSSGRSTATHLHYEVVVEGRKANPLSYIFSGKEIYD